jgi:hypothetical protein
MPRQNVAGVDLGPDGDLITTGRAKALVAAVVAQDIAAQAKLVQDALDEAGRQAMAHTDDQGRATMALLMALEQSALAHIRMLSAEFHAYESRTVRGRVRALVNIVRGWLGYAALKPAWAADPSRFAFSLAHGVAKVTNDPDAPDSPFDRQFMRPRGASPRLVD